MGKASRKKRERRLLDNIEINENDKLYIYKNENETYNMLGGYTYMFIKYVEEMDEEIKNDKKNDIICI